MSWKRAARLFLFGLAVAASPAVFAFDELPAPGPWLFGFALGYPEPVGQTNGVLNGNFVFSAKATYRPVQSSLGVRIDFVHANYSLTDKVLRNVANADYGYATVWGTTLSAYASPHGDRRIKPFVQAGPGFYYQYAEASRSTNVPAVIYDPYWGGGYTVVPADQQLVSRSTWRVGGMVGGGLNFAVGPEGTFFIEVQYHIINNTNIQLEFVPIQIGYDWRF